MRPPVSIVGFLSQGIWGIRVGMEGAMMTKLRTAIASAVIALGLATAAGVATSTPAHADEWGWRRQEQWREWQRERAWRERDWARERAGRERAWREREWRERHWREGYSAPRYYYTPRSYWR